MPTWVIALYAPSLTHVRHQAVVIFLLPTEVRPVRGRCPQDMAVFLEVTCKKHVRDEQVWVRREVADWNVGVSGLFQAVLGEQTESKCVCVWGGGGGGRK